MADRDIAWHVRVDSSVDPIIGVWAPDWYTARAWAVIALDVASTRLHVEMVYGDDLLPLLGLLR